MTAFERERDGGDQPAQRLIDGIRAFADQRERALAIATVLAAENDILRQTADPLSLRRVEEVHAALEANPQGGIAGLWRALERVHDLHAGGHVCQGPAGMAVHFDAGQLCPTATLTHPMYGAGR